MIRVCRCCNSEIAAGHAHVEVLVSQERPRPGMHTSGRIAAVACNQCAPTVADGVLHVASLWTPTVPCGHLTRSLFQ